MSAEVKSVDSSIFKHLIRSLDRLRENFPDVDEECDNWIEQLYKLASIHDDLSSIAHQFDYSPSLKFNGVRSCMSMILALADEMSQTHEALQSGLKDKKMVKKLQILHAQTSIYISMGTSVMKNASIWKDRPNLTDEQLYNEIAECTIDFVDQLDEESLRHFYNLEYVGIWYPEWARGILRKYIRGAYMLFGPKSVLKLFSGPEASRFWADKSSKLNVDFIKNMGGFFLNNILVDALIKTANFLDRNIKVSYLRLEERQNKYFIDRSKKTVSKNPSNVLNDKKPLECVLLKPREYNGVLLFHIHEGGFVTMSAKSMVPVLKESVKITNCALLSVEYTLAPEGKHPVALQECLDVYLNIISSQSILDFKPDKIVFFGGSSGGFYVISLAIALAELRHLQQSSGEPLTPLPRSIICIVPVASGCFGHLFPSRYMLEGFILHTGSFLTTNAYIGPIDEEKYFDEHGQMWYQDRNLLRKVAKEINLNMNDPFVNLPEYKHFDRLKDVSLYVSTAEFDFALDDAINLAKAWQGKKVFQVTPGLPHVWTGFEPMAPKGTDSWEILKEGMRQAIQW